MKKISILCSCIIALVALVGWAPNVFAYGNFDGGCQSCHGGFRSGGYVSNTAQDGVAWNGSLHSGHQGFAGCMACHQSIGDNPLIAGPSGDGFNSCMGCHGRDEDANNLGTGPGRGAGLRQHHWVNGITTTCSGCHPDSNPANFTPVGEDVPGARNADLGIDPCNNAVYGVYGLDNDGDNLYDLDDLDCSDPTKNDFDGNGTSDVLVRNTANGRWHSYLMEGGLPVVQNSRIAMFEDVNVEYMGTGDFDGDGDADVLVRNSANGRWHSYLMEDGLPVVQNSRIAMFEDVNVEYMATGDFDGDGDADVLVRNSANGRWHSYLMEGGLPVVQNSRIAMFEDVNVEYMATGDFDGDGDADVLVRNSANGRWHSYLMEGGLPVVQNSRIAMFEDVNVEYMGTGDFDGDGDADVLVRNSANGRWHSYLMEDGLPVVQNSRIAMFEDVNVEYMGTGDFDGDGDADVLVRNIANGRWHSYLMEGGLPVVQNSRIAMFEDVNVEYMGTGDFDGDGDADVLVRNIANGRWHSYLMEGGLPVVQNSRIAMFEDLEVSMQY